MDPGFFLKGREGLQDNFWHDFNIYIQILRKKGSPHGFRIFFKGEGIIAG